MRNLFITTLALVAMGLAAWGASYWMSCEPELHWAASQGDAALWLKTEFHLSDAQLAEIRRLHEAYDLECEAHCAAIAEAHRGLVALKGKGTASAAELAAAKLLVTKREDICRTAIRGHLIRVAALMPSGEGERYLALLLPRVDAFEHHGAPTLRLDP
jgi:hypothetical protein